MRTGPDNYFFHATFRVHRNPANIFRNERLEPAQPTVRGDRHEPVAAVVRDEHAVTLEPLENGPRMRRKLRRVEVLAKPQPFPHPGQIQIRLRAREVTGRIDELAPRPAHGHTHGMCDAPPRDFIVPNDGREDRKARRVRRRPSFGP